MSKNPTKLPVPKPEQSGLVRTLAGRLPHTQEERTLFWLRVIGVGVLLLVLLAGAAVIMLLLSLRQIDGILSNLESASAELEECSRQLSLALQSLNDQGLQELYAVLE